VKSILKYPGSKWRIAKWIVAQMPEHHSYLEPFFGSGAVLFNKKPSDIETVNDLDNRVYTLFKVIREQPETLARMIFSIPYSRYEYDLAFKEVPENEIEIAVQLLIQCWQGHGFRTNGYKVGWKNDVQGREKAYALLNWNRLPGWIMDAAKRLKQVQIEHMPAVELIKRFRYPNGLIYADPPYVLDTRSGKQYKHEMSDKDHIKLLEILLQHPGPVMLSGYNSDLYNETLKGWTRLKTKSNAEGGNIRTEVLWMNFQPVYQLKFNVI
jgi:DNA adenine methylase